MIGGSLPQRRPSPVSESSPLRAGEGWGQGTPGQASDRVAIDVRHHPTSPVVTRPSRGGPIYTGSSSKSVRGPGPSSGSLRNVGPGRATITIVTDEGTGRGRR